AIITILSDGAFLSSSARSWFGASSCCHCQCRDRTATCRGNRRLLAMMAQLAHEYTVIYRCLLWQARQAKFEDVAKQHGKWDKFKLRVESTPHDPLRYCKHTCNGSKDIPAISAQLLDGSVLRRDERYCGQSSRQHSNSGRRSEG